MNWPRSGLLNRGVARGSVKLVDGKSHDLFIESCYMVMMNRFLTMDALL
jgi:hypothetical protein